MLEVPDDELDVTADLTRTILEGIADLRVPLEVEMASGANLAECKS